MSATRSVWSLIAGLLASTCALALAIVIANMIVDSWLTPLSFGVASILLEFALVVIAAILFLLQRPLWGLIASLVGFFVGEVLGRIITDGYGILWPFRNFANLPFIAAEFSGFYALALALLDVAFVLMVLIIPTGLVATLINLGGEAQPSVARAAQSPSAHQGIPAGWYRDPEGKPCQRYWDGTAWTDTTAPLG